MIRDVSTATQAGGTSIVLDRPGAAQPGDFLFACFALGGAPTVTAPSGWTPLSEMFNGGFLNVYSYYRTADVADPASWTFSWSGAEPGAGGIVAYQIGISSFDIQSFPAVVTSATVTANSLPGLHGQLLNIAVFASIANGSFTTPAGMDERFDVSSGAGACISVCDTYQEALDNAPARSSTTTSGRNVGFQMTFRVAGNGWRLFRKTSDSTLWRCKKNDAAADYWFTDGTKVTASAGDWFVTADPLPNDGPDTAGSVSVVTAAALSSAYTEL